MIKTDDFSQKSSVFVCFLLIFQYRSKPNFNELYRTHVRKIATFNTHSLILYWKLMQSKSHAHQSYNIWLLKPYFQLSSISFCRIGVFLLICFIDTFILLLYLSSLDCVFVSQISLHRRFFLTIQSPPTTHPETTTKARIINTDPSPIMEATNPWSILSLVIRR